MSRSIALGILFWLSGWSVAAGLQTENESAPLEWLSGSADTLEFHIACTIVDEEGKPVVDALLKCERNSGIPSEPRDVLSSADGTYRFSIPCNENWSSFKVTATSRDGSRSASRSIRPRDIRTIARDGLELELQPQNESQTRDLKISVIDENGPVPGASVKVNCGGFMRTGVTGADGITVLAVGSGDEPYQITAWKDDTRVGGFILSREPLRDPRLDEYTVELNPSRPVTIKLIDENGSPVPGIEFVLRVATRPHWNFVGETEHCTMVSDQNGEAVANWFPDWPEVNYSVGLFTYDWVIPDRESKPVENDRIEVVLKRSMKDQRERIRGTVVASAGLPAGYCVELYSFQGEVENRSDVIHAFTDQNGSFFADVLPGVTYHYFIDDLEWLSETEDAILFNPDTGERAAPELALIKGQPITIIATTGPDKRPMANQWISLRSVYHFTWNDDGQQQSGSGGRNWDVQTDENGRATTSATPGPLQASIIESDWRKVVTAEVTEDKPTELVLHRPIADAVRVSGRLSGIDASVAGAELIVAALDGATSEKQTVESDELGRFEFETRAAKVGIHVVTADRGHSGTAILEIPPPGPVELSLLPTVEYRGQLLDENSHPLVGVAVLARVDMNPGYSPEATVERRLRGGTFSATTDESGNYVLTGIPVGIRFIIEYQPAKESGAVSAIRIGERFIFPGEKRPLDVYRVAGAEPVPQPFDEFIVERFGDCRRYGIYSLVVVSGDDASMEWVTQIVSAYDEYPAILGYLPLRLLPTLNDRPERQKFLADHDLRVPDPGHVLLCVLDGNGQEIDRVELDSSNPASTQAAYSFIAANEPVAADAQQKLDTALAEARSSGRVVWVQLSQTRCAPCFELSRWIEEHREVLGKQFVFVKIDDVREKSGLEIVKRITGERSFGMPFVAIMNPEGEVLADFDGPLGNIGFPSGFEGVAHLRKLITTTGDQISESELDALMEALLPK